MRVTEKFPRTRLSMDDVRRTIDAAVRKGIRIVSFTGGEPLLLLDDLIRLIRYAGDAGIEYVRTGTNGFIFMNSHRPGFDSRVKEIAEKLADTPLRNFWISVDSAIPSVHEKMRGFPGIIRGIEKALPVFHEYGIFPSANLGINRNICEETIKCSEGNDRHDEKAYLDDFYEAFRKAIAEFYRSVIDLGFTMVSSCYPMSIDQHGEIEGLKAVYGATSGERLIRFSSEEKALLYRALLETLPHYRSKIRIFSPTSSLYALSRYYRKEPERPYPCRGGIDYFFVNAGDGNTYPCGYRGNESFGRFWEMNGYAANGESPCYRCDWECFRDPSELFGPFLQGLHHPLDLIRKIRRDGHYFRLWIEDLKYYRACRFFDGRRAPDFDKMQYATSM
jgi:MoaA/NifB/PqqE/SkfB family radical SAM enzyme